MAEQTFAAGFAVGVQVDAGTLNATIAALSGSIDSSDGIVLGAADSGIGESGITLPNFVRNATEQADVPGSFTRTANSFLSVGVDAFDITFLMRGNGATSTPSAGEAKPLAGIDALMQMAGLAGANGAAPLYVYTPAAGTIYGTIIIWVGDMSFVLKACVVETMKFAFLGGDSTKVTCTLQVGSVETQSDGVALPTFDYTTQSSLSAPVLQGAGFAWGQTRGFRNMDLSISNTLEEFEDSNESTGIRIAQSDRSFDMESVIYVDDGDTDFEYTELEKATAPVADATFQLGVIAGSSDTINAALVEFNNVIVDSYQADRAGDLLMANVSAHASGASAAGEFTLTFN